MATATMDVDVSATSAPAVDAEAVTRNIAAESLVKTYVFAATGVSIIPVPLVDLAGVIGIQLRMIQKLSQLYGKPFSESMGRSIIASLTGGVLGYGAGVTVAISLAKIVPGVGWMLGMASMPVIAGATTYAIGRVFIKHFEEGGSMFDLSPLKSQAYFREQLELGKAQAAKAQAEAHAREAAAA